MFTFIDLFAGIGGMRQSAEANGGKCIFTAEWDKYAQKTYKANFGDNEIHGDVSKLEIASIPDHDLLLASPPCQPFSIAGVSKNGSLGRSHGLDDMRGTLFFDVARIIEAKQPKVFLLENVKNLLSHDKGNTFRVIKDVFDQLGYDIHFKVIDAHGFTPQHRQRIFIVGFKTPTDFDFNRLQKPQIAPQLGSLLEDDVDPKYTLSSRLWGSLVAHRDRHADKGNGFGFEVVERESTHTRTLLARYFKDGSEILVDQGSSCPRRLTPRECARLQGFPDSFKIVCSDTQSYRQFGNSVVVPLVTEIVRLIVETGALDG
jgi:DNA (cytosine-5)-methyltransferase 1